MKAQDRNYRLLEYLNVNTRTSYLARIRNPNPKMPDAHRIAVASLGHESHENGAKPNHHQQPHEHAAETAVGSPTPLPEEHH
jgi:molybdopterin-containing oxidoreductase family iron-sulfur binding subunit